MSKYISSLPQSTIIYTLLVSSHIHAFLPSPFHPLLTIGLISHSRFSSIPFSSHSHNRCDVFWTISNFHPSIAIPPIDPLLKSTSNQTSLNKSISTAVLSIYLILVHWHQSILYISLHCEYVDTFTLTFIFF